MVDPVQIILLLVIVILTILLVVLGIQVFYILKELRNTIKKANKVLDNANSITENIEEPLSAISSLVTGVKSGTLFTIVKFLNGLVGKEKEDKRSLE